jgi:hypothetical protein
VRHWVHGGKTRKDNLVLLCRFHHRLVHEEGFSVERTRDGTFRFGRPDGRRISDTPVDAVERPRARGQPVAA